MVRTSAIDDIYVICVMMGALSLAAGCNSDQRRKDGDWRVDARAEDAEDTTLRDAGDTAPPDAVYADSTDSVDGSDAADVSDAGGGDAGPNEARVFVLQDPAQVEGNHHVAFGHFNRSGTLIDQDECTHRSEGACRFEDCPSPEVSATRFVSAGTLRIDGSERTVEISPRTQNIYNERGEGEIWNGTGTVEISASGGKVPGFDVQTNATSGVELLEPSIPPSDEPMTIDRDQPMTVRWRGIEGYSGLFEANILAESSERDTRVRCLWKPDAEEAVIPKRLLQGLAATEDAQYSFGAVDRQTIRSGKWEVLLHVEEIAVDGGASTGIANGNAEVK